MMLPTGAREKTVQLLASSSFRLVVFTTVWVAGAGVLARGWGFGPDLDAWRNAEYMRRGLEAGRYIPTRLPISAPGFEFLNVAMVLLGSFWGTLLTTSVSVAMLWTVYGILRRDLQSRHPLLLVLVMALHPRFMIESAENMDYLWGALALVIALRLVLRGGSVFAVAVLAGLSVGLRITNVLPATLMLAVAGRAAARRGRAGPRLVAAALLAAVIGVAAYTPGLWKYGLEILALPGRRVHEGLAITSSASRFASFYYTPVLIAIWWVLVRLRPWRVDEPVRHRWCLVAAVWLSLAAPPLAYRSFHEAYLVVSWPFFVLMLSRMPWRWLAVFALLFLGSGHLDIFSRAARCLPGRASAAYRSVAENPVKRTFRRARNRRTRLAAQAEILNRGLIPPDAFVITGQVYSVFAWHLSEEARRTYTVRYYLPADCKGREHEIAGPVYAVSENLWDAERARGVEVEAIRGRRTLPRSPAGIEP